MTDATHDARGNPSLGRAFRTMPGWKWKLLLVGLVVGVVGVGGQLGSKAVHGSGSVPVTETPPTHVTPGSSAVAPPGASGFVGGSPPAPDSTPSQPTTPAVTPGGSPSVMDQVTPYLSKFGFSFVVGLVLGLIVRTFLGFAALLTGVVVAAALALSYFHVINVDLSAVKDQTGQATSWVTEQAGHLKDLIFAHLPSAGAAGAGFLVGMKRR